MACIKRKLIRLQKNQITNGQHHYLSLLDYLSKRQKEAIHLKFYLNMDSEQIANHMKINAQLVYNLIFGSLKILKSKMIQKQLNKFPSHLISA